MNIFLRLAFTKLTTTLLKTAIDEVNKSMHCLTISELCNYYSPIIDEFILKYEEKGFSSGGGNFVLKCQENKVHIKILLYFQDSHQQWNKMELENIMDTNFFNTEAIEQIVNAKEITLPIEVPNKKVA